MNEFKELLLEIDDHITLFENGTISTAGDVDFQIKKTIDQIGRYIQSKYIGGMKDKTTGKRLRFRNIGNAIVDLEWRAKNIDRKAIEATALDGDFTFSMIVNKELQKWMKLSNFGKIIDDYQRKKSEYGDVLLKKTIIRDKKNKKKLLIEPVSWSYAKVNVRDIDGGIKIDTMEMSPMELRKRGDVWNDDEIEKAIQLHKKDKADGRDIEVLDIEGEFPTDYFEESENEVYKTALYNVIVAKVGDKKFVLNHDELKESRYKHDSRKTVEGRDFGVGVWEELFEPQIAINEAVIAEADAMDIAGKVVIKTNKKDVPSALSLINGEIISLERDEFMESMSLAPSALPVWSNLVDEWFVNAQRDQSAFQSLTGEEAKAGTPFAAQALQSAQSSSIFNKRRDNDGFFLNKIIMEWALPFVIDEIKAEHELTAAYSPMELKRIDKVIHIKEGNKFKIDKILNEEELTPEGVEDFSLQLDDELALKQGERTIKIPKEYITMDKIEKKLRFDITDEMSDSQRELNALATRLQSLPPEDPARMQIINQMGELAGISPGSFGGQATQPVKPQGVTAQPSKVEQVVPEGQR